MVVSVLSPIRGQAGVTNTALTIAHALALTQHKDVCLTHVDYSKSDITSALGITASEDITRSLGHVVKMLINGALRAEEVPEYALKTFKGLDVYSTHASTLEENEALRYFETLITNMTAYGQVVIDVDTPIGSKATQKVIESSDIIVVPITQNAHLLGDVLNFRKQLDAMIKLALVGKRNKHIRVVYLVNHYIPQISSKSAIAKRLGVSLAEVLTVRYSPNFTRARNLGTISDVYIAALKGDGRIAGLSYDMKSISKSIMGKDFVWDGDFSLLASLGG